VKQSRTFGQRLAIGLALIASLTALMVVVSFAAQRSAVQGFDALLTHEVESLLDVQRLRVALALRSGSLRGFLLTREGRFESSVRERDGEVDLILSRLGGRALTSQSKARLAEAGPALARLRSENDRLIALRKADADTATVERQFEEQVLPPWDLVQAAMTAIEAAETASLAQARADAAASSDASNLLVILLGAGCLVLSFVVAIVLTRSLGRQIGGSVQHVRASSTELQAAATQQASSAREQATAMSEIATTISELLVTARQIAQSAQRVARVASDASAGARGGVVQVQAAQEASALTRRQTDDLVKHVLDLGRRSQQVGSIIEIITELAEQTNILAINASIEAAGAGDAGRRFAVVAEEIRRLADRVGGSTREIRALIDEIRGAVNTTVMATEAGSKAVDAASGRFSELAEAFRRIAEGIATTNDATREIELSTQQQTTAVEQVNAAIGNVAQATREAEAAASQTLQTAGQLAVMSSELTRMVKSDRAAA